MSILARLVILVLLALTPAIAALAINEILLYRDREQEIRQSAAIDAQVRNTELDSVVGGIQHLLGTVVHLPAIASLDRSSCNEELEGLTKEYRHDLILIAADVNGAVLCSSVSIPSGAAVADEVIVQEVVGSGQFKVGGYGINPVNTAKALSFGYPILAAAGGLSGV